MATAKIMCFPDSYKKALLHKTKNCTIRTGQELGKYQENCVYDVFSYGQTDWKIKIKLDRINKVKISALSTFKVPKRSIKSLINKTHLKPEDKVELIHFSYVD